MSPRYRQLGLASALALTGCMTGPDYARPEVIVPQAWSDQQVTGIQQGVDPVARWWTQLNDPQLNLLIEQAIANNVDVQIAETRVRQARAARGIAAAAMRPSVGASASYRVEESREVDFDQGGSPVSAGLGFGPGGLTRTFTYRGKNATVSRSVSAAGPNTSVTVTPGGGGGQDRINDYFAVGFDAAWELDIFGGNRRAIEAADAEIEAAEERRRDILVVVLSEVALNYTELRAAQQRLAIAQRNIEAQRDTVRLTRARFEAGLNSELDTIRAESLLATTQSQVPLLEEEIQRDMHRLAVLLGSEPTALKAELDAVAPIPAAPTEIPVGLPSELLQRRPDIRAAERTLAAQTARIGVAVADLYPKFTLTGSLSGLDSGFGFLDSANRTWSIGPGVSWPIFDAGRIRANIEVQNARQEEALRGYEQSILLALEDVENGLLGFAKEQQRRAALARAVEANARAVRLANERYLQGLEDFLTVLDAQQRQYQSEDQLVQSEGFVMLNLISLYKALGGGWEDI
jgi:multidrug efflux system outer membrane protein